MAIPGVEQNKPMSALKSKLREQQDLEKDKTHTKVDTVNITLNRKATDQLDMLDQPRQSASNMSSIMAIDSELRVFGSLSVISRTPLLSETSTNFCKTGPPVKQVFINKLHKHINNALQHYYTNI
uniref:Uncharacterized protein n=1 Tax=Glossina pallidipes TaxID=7398 RepID=A0A1A9ZI46_GLOPL